MKKSYIIIGVVALLGIWLYNSYNGMVTLNEQTSAQWAQVENAYQLRADKTKNLVAIVKGAAEFEKETLESVINARAKATSVNINAGDLTPEKVAQFEQAQQQFSGSLSKLLVTVERYPELKATEGFRDFQAQYEGMENRIGVERRKFNEIVGTYNIKIKKLPTNLIANFLGFTEKGYFKGNEGTENAPDIDLSI